MSDTHLPLDAAARNLLHYINVMPDADTLLTPEVLLAETQLRAALSQPDTLAARVAELEAEARGYWRCMNEQTAHANALRDALKKAHVELCDDVDGGCAANGRACSIAEALAAHPAASLAALKAEVLERGCSAIREVRIEHTPALEDDDQGPFLHESDVANLTRAIVERAHKTRTSGGADCMAQEVTK